jgi:antitoxin component of RelBE/YafQ-DinJ toxin-antitoxin module
MVTDKEKERFEDLAYGLGLTVSDLIRRLLSQAADKEVYCNDKAD